MAPLKVNQTKSKLLEMFQSKIPLNDIAEHDKEREEKILSRSLAAIALVQSACCTEDEAAKSVWDGSGDNGIDAAYFDSSESQVIFVQSKWISKGTGEPSAADIGSFTKGVLDVVEGNSDEFDQRVHTRFSEIETHLNKPGTTVKIIVISTGSSKLAAPAMSRIHKLLEELNGADQTPIAEYAIYGLNEVYSCLANSESISSVNLTATVQDWACIQQPYTAYFGTITGRQLKYWWNSFGKRLVSKNIRHSLGSTSVNYSIQQTALNTPDHFWYFNNGITMIADDATRSPNSIKGQFGVFDIKKASIVNGAQTISSIGRVQDDEQLEAVRVPFRFILLNNTPSSFGYEITRTNNLQNRIEPRDFVAQDKEQLRLRQEMNMEDVEYYYARSVDSRHDESSCELIELTIALACASGDSSLAVMAKTGIGRFFANLKATPYLSIFNASLSGARAFNVTLVHRHIEAWVSARRTSKDMKTGTGKGCLVHGNRILEAVVFKNISTKVSYNMTIREFKSSDFKKIVDGVIENALQKMINCIRTSYANNVLAVLFKNPAKSKDVFLSST